MKEALYYESKGKNKVQCLLCPHNCVIAPGKVGLCQVRRNEEGTLFSLNYNRVSSINLDPIEKKPLYNFYPGSYILSLGSLGCNLSCSFCQNANISQLPGEEIDRYFNTMTQTITPEQVVEMAAKYKSRGNIGVAYTYNEPSIWYEFILDTAKMIRKQGLINVLVTNGYLETDPLEKILPYIDAVNVDLKSMDDDFYKNLCGGRLNPVLNYLEIAREKVFIEVTNLVVTGENDSDENLQALVDWIADNLGRDTPLHLSRYRPEFKLNSPSTPVETLYKAYEMARKKLNYVYVGNIWGGGAWENTHCPKCNSVVINRTGYHLNELRLKEGNICVVCGNRINVVVQKKQEGTAKV
jgi:pyruvate formate lyase activating enzyme